MGARVSGCCALSLMRSSTFVETGDHVRNTVRSGVQRAPSSASAAMNAGSSRTPRAKTRTVARSDLPDFGAAVDGMREAISTERLEISSSFTARANSKRVIDPSAPGTVTGLTDNTLMGFPPAAEDTTKRFCWAASSGVVLASMMMLRASRNAAVNRSVRSITGGVVCTTASPERSHTSVTRRSLRSTKRSASMSFASHSPLRTMKPTRGVATRRGMTAYGP